MFPQIVRVADAVFNRFAGEHDEPVSTEDDQRSLGFPKPKKRAWKQGFFAEQIPASSVAVPALLDGGEHSTGLPRCAR
jgi:hypothetical protein